MTDKRSPARLADAAGSDWNALVAEVAAHDATKAEFEAFRRDVSEAVKYAADYRNDSWLRAALSRFILPEPVDQIEELCSEMFDNGHKFHANRLREALAKRGLTITKEQPHEQY